MKISVGSIYSLLFGVALNQVYRQVKANCRCFIPSTFFCRLLSEHRSMKFLTCYLARGAFSAGGRSSVLPVHQSLLIIFNELDKCFLASLRRHLLVPSLICNSSPISR